MTPPMLLVAAGVGFTVGILIMILVQLISISISARSIATTLQLMRIADQELFPTWESSEETTTYGPEKS